MICRWGGFLDTRSSVFGKPDHGVQINNTIVWHSDQWSDFLRQFSEMLVLLKTILMNIENVHKVSFMDFILPEHVYYYKMFFDLC